MSTALEHLATRAERDAVTFAADADRFSAQGKGIIAHHYRRVATRRRETAQALREQIKPAKDGQENRALLARG